MSSVIPSGDAPVSNEDAEPMTAAVLSVYLMVLIVTFLTVYKLANTVKWQWIPSSCLYILSGMLVYGGLCMRFNNFNPSFDPTVFFLMLLPPVIFNSGLEVNIPIFFQNYATIMVFANLGTIINAIVIGLIMYWVGSVDASPTIMMSEGLSFGSVVSATDPVTTIAVFDRFKVDPNLYTIIVGVSVLDDAISVILFKIFNAFISGDGLNPGGLVLAAILFLVKMFGSMACGFCLGLIFSHLIHFQVFKENKTLLMCISIFYLYFIYAIADAFYLSGIISSMLAGISFQYFHKYRQAVDRTNVNQSEGDECFEQVRSLINQWSFLFESIVFVYIGLTVFYHPARDNGDAAFVFWSFVACIIGRVAQIYPLSQVLNFYQKQMNSDDRDRHVAVRITEDSSHDNSHPPQPEVVVASGGFPVQLTIGYQHMMMLAGLRGPIAYATSQWFSDRYGHQNLISFATTFIVIATTAVFGALTMPGLNWFHISFGEDVADEESLSITSRTDNVDPTISLPWYLRVTDEATAKAIDFIFFGGCCFKSSTTGEVSVSSMTEEGRVSIALSQTSNVETEDEEGDVVEVTL